MLWKRMAEQGTAFCVVAKVLSVVNRVLVSAVTAIRGESLCNSTDADIFPQVCIFLSAHMAPETWIS